MAAAFARTTRALTLDSPRWSMAALAVGGLVLAAWLAWFLGARVTLYEVSQQARLEVGTAAREVSPIQSGRLVASGLVIGRHVEAGAVLVELDAASQRLRLADAERRLADYPARLASLAREIAALGAADAGDQGGALAAARSAQARLQEAETAARAAGEQARRQAADAEIGGIARSEAMKAAAEARRAGDTRNALAEEARKTGFDAVARRGQNAARIEELAQARLALEAERDATASAIAQLRNEIENRIVRAPVSGTIGEVQALQPGAVVGAGQRLATIVPSGDLILVAEFDPASALGRIRPGQHAILRLAGYPWAQYGSVGARVERVAGELRNGRLRVELRATRNDMHGVRLAHGLAGTVEVEVESLSPARLLARSLSGSS
jgi:adhesin transport system membrane fusion protein